MHLEILSVLQEYNFPKMTIITGNFTANYTEQKKANGVTEVAKIVIERCILRLLKSCN